MGYLPFYRNNMGTTDIIVKCICFGTFYIWVHKVDEEHLLRLPCKQCIKMGRPHVFFYKMIHGKYHYVYVNIHRNSKF